VSAEIKFDASDFVQLSRAIGRLPGEIKAKALARAMRRVTDTARSRVVKRSAERIDIPQNLVREKTTAMFNAGGNTSQVVVRSGWIPLYKIGATQTSRGVRVRMRGSYNHAFIAKMASGHVGVMRRVGMSRLPIRELFGPNPANDIVNHDQVYLQVLAEVMDDVLLPRVLHELGRILAK
jgi:hypothetical protein